MSREVSFRQGGRRFLGSMTEYAVFRNGEIAVVVTCESEQSAQKTAQDIGGPFEVKAFDLVPLAVKQRYRYWGERP